MYLENENKIDYSSLPVFAGAVVLSLDGKILNQLRDDKPDILYPGYWSCAPGGHVDPGESPNTAVIREMREEFGIELTNIKPIVTLFEPRGEIAGTHHSYSAELSTPIEKVQCFEGQKVEFFYPSQALKLKQIPLSKKILELYLNSLTP